MNRYGAGAGAAQGVGFSPGAGEVRAWQRWEAVRRAGPDEEANARGGRDAGGLAGALGPVNAGCRHSGGGYSGKTGPGGRCPAQMRRRTQTRGRVPGSRLVGWDVVAALRRGRCLVYPWVRRAEKRGYRRLSPLLLVASGGPGGCRRKRWRRVEEQSTRGKRRRARGVFPWYLGRPRYGPARGCRRARAREEGDCRMH